MKKSPVMLSQCMIVKNEEKNIEKALSWGKGIVCEQIVVDTGSTDKTVELAEKMGAKVLNFRWIDDFAAAKNYAIDQASGDWIAFLDADEYFAVEDAEKLLSLLETVNSNKEVQFIRSKWIHIKEDKTVIGVSCQDRIFRNDVNLRYRYRIHEELHHKKIKEAVGYYDAQDELGILHTGYGNEQLMPEKGVRNAKLLERDLADNPTDAMRLMYLGDAYNISGKTEKALDCYRKVLWRTDLNNVSDIAVLRSGLQVMSIRINEPVEAIEDELFKIVDRLKACGGTEHPDVDFFIGYWYLKKNNIKSAAYLFETAMEKMNMYGGLEVMRITSALDMINWVIAADAFINKDLKKTVRNAITAIQINKYSADALSLLLKAFFIEFKNHENIEPYWNIIMQLYDISNLKDLLFVRKFAKDVGFDTIAQKAYALLPQEVKTFVE